MERNGIIASTALGNYTNHGIFTSDVTIDYGNGVQAYGGWALDNYEESAKGRKQTVLTGVWIAGILKAAGAETWEKLKGCPVRVRIDESRQRIIAIGHYLKDDCWFNMDDVCKEYR